MSILFEHYKQLTKNQNDIVEKTLIKDLLDKGFLSSNMTGITCAEVRQMDDRAQIAIKVLNEKLEQYKKLILQETGEYGAPVKPYEKDCYFHTGLNK
jgi:hypothetical protein